jgi:hypothetical protein
MLNVSDVIELIKKYAGRTTIGGIGSHARSHALDGTSDHTIGGLTTGYLAKSDGTKLVPSTNTDAAIAAAITASHAAATVADTATIDMSITGQQISGTVIPGGIAHNDLASKQGGTTGEYYHLTNTQISALHARSHALDGTADHSIGGLTSGYLAKSDGTKLIPSTNTDTAIAAAVTASHARSHAIDGTSDHTGITGTENNFMALNATGLPKDSGSKAGDFAPIAHNLLSATHGDSTVGSCTRGDVITGQGVTPKWVRLAISAPAVTYMNYLGVANGDTEPAYKAMFDATVPTTISAGASAATGSAVVAARRDHTHGTPSTYPATAHNLLSAIHGDTTVASCVRGDLVTGQGASPLWTRLAISAPAATYANYLGTANGDTEPGYKALFDATVPGTIAAGASAATGSATVAARRDHTHGAPSTYPATSHALDSTTYHSIGSLTSGYLTKSNGTNLVPSTNTDAAIAAAVTASHARSHALDGTSDHSIGSLTNTYLVKSDGTKLVPASNTDAQVSGAVTASHARSHALDGTSDHSIGSLTTGYSPYILTNKLVNSPVYTDGINIGIGTASPGAKLNIVENTSATAITVILDSDVASNRGTGISYRKNGLSKGYVGIEGWWLGSTSNNIGVCAEGDIKFYTNGSGTPLVTIGDTLVGIATSVPGSKLSVAGNVSIGASYAATAAPANGMIVEGSVGIGTTAPGTRLSVKESAGATAITMTLDNDVTNNRGSAIDFNKSGSMIGRIGVSGLWQGDTTTAIAIGANTSSSIRFYTNGVTLARAEIDIDGNLIVRSGYISTNDGTNQWNLGGYTATGGGCLSSGYVTVTINGIDRKLAVCT